MVQLRSWNTILYSGTVRRWKLLACVILQQQTTNSLDRCRAHPPMYWLSDTEDSAKRNFSTYLAFRARQKHIYINLHIVLPRRSRDFIMIVKPASTTSGTEFVAYRSQLIKMAPGAVHVLSPAKSHRINTLPRRSIFSVTLTVLYLTRKMLPEVYQHSLQCS